MVSRDIKSTLSQKARCDREDWTMITAKNEKGLYRCHCEESTCGGRRSNLRVLVDMWGNSKIATPASGGRGNDTIKGRPPEADAPKQHLC